MNEKKYLVYVDILGFEDLARVIAKKSGFEEDWIRQNCLSDPLEKKIEEIKREGIQIPQGISEIEGSDNYVLIVDHIQTVFELVGKLTTIRIPHKDYKFIPLEVGLGTKEIDEDIEVKPINRKEIIKFLKSDIINPYRSYYKNKKKHGAKIKETFVLFTPDFFDDLEPLDKKYCELISYETKTFFVADLDKVQQRGRVFDFLEKIRHAGSKLYGRIDEVYVPPLEYEDMARTLKEKRIVFITGTPEYGKTYTAVKFMWEYYTSGYEPRWINPREPADRDEVRETLENMCAELKSGHIIYFEDHFGKNEYVRRDSLERKIGILIDTVRQVEDVYVILTSREEVFKEFKKSANVPKEFEKKLNVKKPYYDYEKRKEILLSWAEEENCKWLGNAKLKELVLEAIKDEKILPTPMNIRAFAKATFDKEEESVLKEEIKEKSKETANVFAEEIKNMTNDKILFLSFLSIYDSLSVEFIRTTYQELREELNLKDPWGFDRVLNWFKDDKINIDAEDIRFSHPSYSEALKNLLVEDGDFTRINRAIFSKLMLKLAEKRGDTIFFLMAVADNFYELPEDVKTNILLDLLEKDAAAWAVARVVANKPDTLPEDVTAWLFKLSEYDEAVWEVARAVADNFDKFPDDARNKLLLNLSKKDEATWAVLFAVVYNFDKFPDDVRNKLLLNLSEKDAAVWWRNEKAIVYNFDKLPENVKKSLDRLPEPLQQVIEDNVRIAKNSETTERIIKNIEANGGITEFIEASSRIKERLQTLCLEANTFSQLCQNFLFKIVNKK